MLWESFGIGESIQFIYLRGSIVPNRLRPIPNKSYFAIVQYVTRSGPHLSCTLATFPILFLYLTLMYQICCSNATKVMYFFIEKCTCIKTVLILCKQISTSNIYSHIKKLAKLSLSGETSNLLSDLYVEYKPENNNLLLNHTILFFPCVTNNLNADSANVDEWFSIFLALFYYGIKDLMLKLHRRDNV